MDAEAEEGTGVILSKGININKDLFSGAEFHIDVDFKEHKNRSDVLLADEDELFGDDLEDSDTAEVLKTMERSVEARMLASPEYSTFKELEERMTDCLPSGDVKILIFEEGTGPLVPYDAEVSIHYAAYWEKELVPFDCTLTQNFGMPRTYALGTRQLLAGLEIGLTTVRGPRARFALLVRPAAAWGPRGVPPRIRPEPALFTVALLGCVDTATMDRFNDLPTSEQQKFEVTVKAVTAHNTKAKQLFSKRAYQKAVVHYHKNLTILQLSRPDNDEQRADIVRMLTNAYVNLAVCYAKLQNARKVLLMCDDLARTTDIEKHCKGLYYYGKAFVMLGDYAEALKYYKKAKKLEPKNCDIGKSLAELDAILSKSKKDEKQMWRKAFHTNIEEKDDVDEDFKNNILETCAELSASEEYTRLQLPAGLRASEIDYIKRLVDGFDGLSVIEWDNRGGKRIEILRNVTKYCAEHQIAGRMT